MTLTACVFKVIDMDGGCWISTGENSVHTMTGCTVSHMQITGFAFQSMKEAYRPVGSPYFSVKVIDS